MQKNRSPCPPLLTQRPQHPPLWRENAAPPQDAVTRETHRATRGGITLTEAVDANGQKVTRFKCVIAQVDIINRNGRYYPRSAYQAAIDAAQEDLKEGLLWGLLEHADDWYDPMKGNLYDIAGLYDTLAIEGDNVVGEGVIADTTVGRDLKGLLAIKVAVGISTACTGTAQYKPARELDPNFPDPEARIPVMQDDLRFVTIDFVSDPSNPAGRARAAERRERQQQRPPTPTPTPSPQEGTMHQKLKALLEKYQGKTIDQIKTEHAAEYLEALEAIARESAAPATPPTPAAPVTGADGQVSPEAYRALEQTVVQLRGTVDTLTTANHNAGRDAMVSTALEAARLPSAGTVKHGETEIDLDASFRAELTAGARTAESDDAARAFIDRKIVERRAALGIRESAKPKEQVRNGVNLPSSDNSRTVTTAERREQQPEGARLIESARGRSGLL